MKKSNKKVYIFKPKQTKSQTTTKIKKTKIISMLTYCQCCKKETIKKNKIQNHYVCDECKFVDQKIQHKEAPKYVNWDADLDFLYNHFWLDDTK